MPRFEENEILMEEFKSFELIESDDFKFTSFASKKKDDDDDSIEEEEEKEEVGGNPFDKEPTEQDILENDIPLIDPEDDLLDDDEEVPYN